MSRQLSCPLHGWWYDGPIRRFVVAPRTRYFVSNNASRRDEDCTTFPAPTISHRCGAWRQASIGVSALQFPNMCRHACMPINRIGQRTYEFYPIFLQIVLHQQTQLETVRGIFSDCPQSTPNGQLRCWTYKTTTAASSSGPSRPLNLRVYSGSPNTAGTNPPTGGPPCRRHDRQVFLWL